MDTESRPCASCGRPMDTESRPCASCGRPMENLKALAKSPEKRYCSQLCRREKLEKRDLGVETYILKRLEGLSGKNICPSMISREVFAEDWRQHHERVIRACRRLSARGLLTITQKKKTVRHLNFKGPIRIERYRV